MSSRCTWSPVGKIRKNIFTRSYFAWLTQNSPLKEIRYLVFTNFNTLIEGKSWTQMNILKSLNCEKSHQNPFQEWSETLQLVDILPWAGPPPGDEFELEEALSLSLSSLFTCLSDVGLGLWPWFWPFDRLFGTSGDVETSATSMHST